MKYFKNDTLEYLINFLVKKEIIQIENLINISLNNFKIIKFLKNCLLNNIDLNTYDNYINYVGNSIKYFDSIEQLKNHVKNELKNKYKIYFTN